MSVERHSSPAKSETPTAERTHHQELVARFRGRLMVLAARRLPDPSEAEDVAQETLQRVMEALRDDRLQSLEALPAFVYQTARHVCLQRARKWTRRRRAYERWRRGAGPGHADPEALTALIGAERCAAVRQAFSRMDSGERELLHMIYYEEIDATTVASRLRVTRGAFRVRKHRALQRLSELLQEGGRSNVAPLGGT